MNKYILLLILLSSNVLAYKDLINEDIIPQKCYLCGITPALGLDEDEDEESSMSYEDRVLVQIAQDEDELESDVIPPMTESIARDPRPARPVTAGSQVFVEKKPMRRVTELSVPGYERKKMEKVVTHETPSGPLPIKEKVIQAPIQKPQTRPTKVTTRVITRQPGTPFVAVGYTTPAEKTVVLRRPLTSRHARRWRSYRNKKEELCSDCCRTKRYLVPAGTTATVTAPTPVFTGGAPLPHRDISQIKETGATLFSSPGAR